MKFTERDIEAILLARRLWIARAEDAEREVEALRADKERLDWLQDMDNAAEIGVYGITNSTDLRKAIDAARAGGQEG